MSAMGASLRGAFFGPFRSCNVHHLPGGHLVRLGSQGKMLHAMRCPAATSTPRYYLGLAERLALDVTANPIGGA